MNQTIRQLLQQKVFSVGCLPYFNPYSRSIFDKLRKCHTAAIGVHEFKCNNATCNHVHYQYHNCGNRHCPNCGGMKREQWLQNRMSELLPTTYYHIVFTLPQELHSLVMGNRTELLGLLFDAAHHSLNTLAKDPQWLGGKLGIVSVLHTWGQTLSFHPHIHCIVSGGGIDAEGKWIPQKRQSGKFLFPRKAIESIFKAEFLSRLQSLKTKGKLAIEDVDKVEASIQQAGFKRWNVYAKAPFGGPAQIMEYLGRYTHKIAITPHRIINITDENITFKYKDYADDNKQKVMTLSIYEFLRRFEQHFLPFRFVKIRHAGFMSHNGKDKRIKSIHDQLHLPPPMPKVKIPIDIQVLQRTGKDITICPKCKTGKLILICTYIFFKNELVDAKILQERRNRGSPKNIRTHEN